jgi:drug/metabolite transporter (DMT)-like permease
MRTMKLQRASLARILLFVTPALWSANYIVGRLAPGVIEPHALALVRWSIAFAVMLPFAWSELRERWPQWRTEWKDLILLGALGMWICGAFVYIGARTTPAVNISLVYACSPVMIAAVSSLWFHERLRPLQWLGAALALSGMLLIIAKADWSTFVHLSFTVGDWWIVVAVLSWTAYSLLLKNRKTCLGVVSRSAAITLGGIIVLIPFTLIETSISGLSHQLSWKALWLGVLAALLPGVGAYQAYAFMQRELGAAKTGLVLYLGPLYAAMTGWLFLGEQPQLFHLLGAVLILPGVYLASRSQ